MSLKPIPERDLDVGQNVKECISLLKNRYGAVLTHDSGHAQGPTWIYTLATFRGAQIAVRMNKQKLSLYLRGITVDGKKLLPLLDMLAEVENKYGPEFGNGKPANSLLSEDHAPFLTPRRNPLLLIAPKPGMLGQIMDKYLGINGNPGAIPFGTPADSWGPYTAKDSAPPISSVTEQGSVIPIDAQASLESDTRGLKTAEREAVVKVRFGQGSFREALFKEKCYGGKCWMSGIEGGRLLIASHIKPWSHCEADPDSRGRTDNGLLLSALWDAAFDAGLVSFDPDWKVVVSSELSESAKYALNLNTHSTLPEMFRTEGRKVYLAYHYANVFEKNKELP